ncbi:hypothetical protein CO010_03655 [Candidatus Shapirobacteria bacterium CG_4_8_14_3_um_filter_39_11]|uniref:Peptidoglycan glycosyltransferase n=1 Tax=Candidatus Shapirobacteria bacterium CG_4_8_14_3_um_filter_39_11 TaxID=1974875 RepID=A0A2M8GFL0_9BACT|nr:MAG: hypothetical protein CO010_03655 [Candidatus Shapirobacteria bacterium CG_4_8_14_3_um_filter_39_11]
MKFETKTRLVLILLIGGFAAVLGKLLYWQIFQQKKIKLLATEQYQHFQKTNTERGKILASDNYPLVMNQNSYLLFADPSRLQISPDQLLTSLEKYLGKNDINKDLLSDKKNFWVPLKENVSEEERGKIQNLGIVGLNFEIKESRYYPEASMSAQFLGFVGKDESGQAKGYFGLEGYYDKELTGKEGSFFYEKDALGKPLPIGNIKVEKLIAGRDLILNIDRGMQFLIEKKLKEGIEKYGAVSGTVLVLDPKNGAVLSMASFPSYDPSVYYSFDQEIFRNPVISSIFEPGSIFKVLVMAAAIDSRSVAENEQCGFCDGPKTIADYTIKTWNEKYYPDSTMTDILVHSDNVGMVYVSEKIGIECLLNYLGKFGLTDKTNIDLQGEVSSKVKPVNLWLPIDLATASFGQGIAFTPVQILTAVSAIANNGETYEPQMVQKIQENGKTIEIKPVKKGRPISEKTANIIKKMMVEAVEKGEAKWAKPPGYTIAGKTGTAQIPIEGHYDPEKTIASFIGFGPVDNPSFAMLVTLNEPKTSPWGSETAAPLWFSIAKDIFRIKKIAPDDN